MDFKEHLKVAKEAALAAGKIQLSYLKKLKAEDIQSKKSLGLVTKADVLSEKKIKSILLKKFPDDLFLGEEESFELGHKPKKLEKFYRDHEYTWVVDPLDGTTNFVHRLDCFCVCIGLLHFGKPVLGLVYRPTTDELYFGTKGGGSFKGTLVKNSRAQKLWVENKKIKLKDSLLATGFASEKGKALDREFALFYEMMKRVRGVRRLGSAAIDLCYVAEGIFQGFWEKNLAPWDITAASVICSEANIKLSNYEGSPFDPFQRSTIATNKAIYRQLSKQINLFG